MVQKRHIYIVRRCTAVLCCTVVLAACQPVDRPPTGGAEGRTTAPAPLGVPDQQFPQTLDALLDRAGRAAEQWQDGAVMAEIAVELEQGRWRSAEVMYLAPGSDRFLRFTASSEGVEQSRPTLATLSLQTIDEPGIEQIPPVPKGFLDPDALLSTAQSALTDCGIDPRSSWILYATGAPFAWDGSRWTQKLAWTVIVSDDQRLLLLDPVSAAPERADACAPTTRR
jgi:hypothetical protein